ncbi:MAG: DUF3892 domain-containing protein [Bacteroidota bacterium]
MAKWADYLVSHVRKNNQGVITHLLLHPDNGDTIGSIGTIQTEAQVIQLIKSGKTVKTIVWGYPTWNQGATVNIVKGLNGEYLRTDRDKTAKDNLDNIIPMYN